jgi:hypothetical protein
MPLIGAAARDFLFVEAGATFFVGAFLGAFFATAFLFAGAFLTAGFEGIGIFMPGMLICAASAGAADAASTSAPAAK